MIAPKTDKNLKKVLFQLVDVPECTKIPTGLSFVTKVRLGHHIKARLGSANMARACRHFVASIVRTAFQISLFSMSFYFGVDLTP